MSALRFAVSLLFVLGVHALGQRVVPGFAVYVDLFLVLTVAWAFETGTLGGLAVGLAAGLAADALSGGLYGLNGFADTLIGYLTAFSVANLAKMNTSGASLLYAVAAVVQQAVLIVLVVLLIPNGAPPPLLAVAGKTIATALLGAAVFRGRKRFARAWGRWRHTRDSKLRF